MMAQLRFTVKSIMNIANLPTGSYSVAMPEMQFFGLPASPINGGSTTVTYLKAEDSAGKLHDILGRHQRLPYYSYNGSSTTFRFYLSAIHNIKSTDKKVYLSMEGVTNPGNAAIDESPYQNIAIAVSGDHRSTPTYYELYINSDNNEKIILSSGYLGVPT